MSELILELYSEEIPAHMQENAANNLFKNIQNLLEQYNIKFSNHQIFYTCNRIGCIINGLPLLQETVNIEKKGPNVNAPEQAISGFLKSNNVELKDLAVQNTKKGDFYFLNQTIEGRDTEIILQEILPEAINKIKWPKSMRWGKYNLNWIRPLHNILCVFNKKTVEFDFYHLKSNNKSFGHKVLANNEIIVYGFEKYKEELRNNFVIIDYQERKNKIISELDNISKAHNITLIDDQSLLSEVNGLSEYPTIFSGHIENEFMSLPQEILIISMKTHQKFFSFKNKDESLSNIFAFASNIHLEESKNNIINGNERVLKARLCDAKFFWQQDQSEKLESYNNLQNNIIFHSKIGTLSEKVTRISAIAKFLSVWIPNANLIKVERASLLSKSDLSTKMVSEFPELQGFIGSHYAINQGEDPEVCAAIKEQYMPAGVDDNLPSTPTSIALSLADKLDSLVALFAINEKPTGSKDPYALRRAAIGLIRIILSYKLRIPLKIIIDKIFKLLPKQIHKEVGSGKDNLINDILSFIIERLRVILKNQNVNHEYIDAIFNSGDLEDDLTRLQSRIVILQNFIETDIGKNLITVYKRANNITHIAIKQDKLLIKNKPQIDIKLLSEKDEKTLYNAYKTTVAITNKNIKNEEYEQAMQEIAKLYDPLSEFFTNVMVNCNDKKVKINRLNLLLVISNIIDNVANFSYISGVSDGK